MLDKTLPWPRVILKRDPGTPLPPGCLPQGYVFVSYQDGDEQAWAELELSEPASGGYENQTAQAFPLIKHLI